MTGFDVETIRARFPALGTLHDGRPMAFFDGPGGTQVPDTVIEAVADYYRSSNANHGGPFATSERSDAIAHDAHAAMADLLGAANPDEIKFGANMTTLTFHVSRSIGATLTPGDEVVVTTLDHQANVDPWLAMAADHGLTVRTVDIRPGDVTLDLESLDAVLGPRTKLVAFGWASNAVGTINPVAEITAAAHDAGALVLLDAAQSVPHMPVDVGALGVDFAVLSGHKMLGPSGIGALWARRELLDAMPPFLTGGSMISRVTLAGSEWNEVPWKFEAGTPAIAEAIGLAAAVAYLERIGMTNVRAHERALTSQAWAVLGSMPGLRLLGPDDEAAHAGVISFVVDGIHPHDVSAILDGGGVAVRAGHHCAQPVMDRYDLPATTRASFSVYNDTGDIERLADGIRSCQRTFGTA